MTHHEDMEIWQVTKGWCTEDVEGKPLDVAAVMESTAGYACRVAELSDFSKPWFQPTPLPIRPATDSDDDSAPLYASDAEEQPRDDGESAEDAPSAPEAPTSENPVSGSGEPPVSEVNVDPPAI